MISAVSPISTSRPWRNTAMRSAMPAASAMSWLMKTSAMPSAFTSRVDQRARSRPGRWCRARWSARRRSAASVRRRSPRRWRCAGAGRRKAGADRPARCVRDRAGGRGRSVRRPASRARRRSRPRWARTTSAIWSPTRMTGSRLAPGSWKTKPMSRPLTGARPRPGQSMLPEISCRAAAGRRAPAPACSCPSRFRRSPPAARLRAMIEVDAVERGDVAFVAAIANARGRGSRPACVTTWPRLRAPRPRPRLRRRDRRRARQAPVRCRERSTGKARSAAPRGPRRSCRPR